MTKQSTWGLWEGEGRGGGTRGVHGRGGTGVGGPPPPSLVGPMMLCVGQGYIGQARPQDVTPSFEFVLG